MLCFVYKSQRKSDTYLFVKHKDDFIDVPPSLREILGKLEFVMEVNLAEREKLARLDSNQLQEHLQQFGYYLQLPPVTEFHTS